MDRQESIQQLRELIDNYLKSEGLDLVDLIYRYEGRDLFLRILADRPEGGISLGECAHLNNELARILDEKNILEARYILEVSSPGLDRPLVTEKDFLRCMNRCARVFLNDLVNGKREWAGRISKVQQESVIIETEGGLVEIALAKIVKAKQILD
jgi:ribosome maturation factor RimP